MSFLFVPASGFDLNLNADPYRPQQMMQGNVAARIKAYQTGETNQRPSTSFSNTSRQIDSSVPPNDQQDLRSTTSLALRLEDSPLVSSENDREDNDCAERSVSVAQQENDPKVDHCEWVFPRPPPSRPVTSHNSEREEVGQKHRRLFQRFFQHDILPPPRTTDGTSELNTVKARLRAIAECDRSHHGIQPGEDNTMEELGTLLDDAIIEHAHSDSERSSVRPTELPRCLMFNSCPSNAGGNRSPPKAQQPTGRLLDRVCSEIEQTPSIAQPISRNVSSSIKKPRVNSPTSAARRTSIGTAPTTVKGPPGAAVERKLERVPLHHHSLSWKQRGDSILTPSTTRADTAMSSTLLADIGIIPDKSALDQRNTSSDRVNKSAEPAKASPVVQRVSRYTSNPVRHKAALFEAISQTPSSSIHDFNTPRDGNARRTEQSSRQDTRPDLHQLRPIRRFVNVYPDDSQHEKVNTATRTLTLPQIVSTERPRQTSFHDVPAEDKHAYETATPSPMTIPLTQVERRPRAISNQEYLQGWSAKQSGSLSDDAVQDTIPTDSDLSSSENNEQSGSSKQSIVQEKIHDLMIAAEKGTSKDECSRKDTNGIGRVRQTLLKEGVAEKGTVGVDHLPSLQLPIHEQATALPESTRSPSRTPQRQKSIHESITTSSTSHIRNSSPTKSNPNSPFRGRTRRLTQTSSARGSPHAVEQRFTLSPSRSPSRGSRSRVRVSVEVRSSPERGSADNEDRLVVVRASLESESSEG